MMVDILPAILDPILLLDPGKEVERMGMNLCRSNHPFGRRAIYQNRMPPPLFFFFTVVVVVVVRKAKLEIKHFFIFFFFLFL